MGPPTTVVLADDHPPIRAAVQEALEAGGFNVVGAGATGSQAVALALKHEPDICLLDIHMPGGSGIDAARKITAALPATTVIMLTVSATDEDLFAAFTAGAAGYLLKDIEPEAIPQALAAAAGGEAALPRSLVARLVNEFRGSRRRVTPAGARPVDLSSREWEVLEGLRDGLSTSQIAARLTIAPVTVRSHVHSLVRKLRVPDRESAVRLFDDQEA